MSITLLISIATIILALTVAAPFHLLVAASLFMVVFPGGQLQVGGVFFDAVDLVYAAVLMRIVFRGRPPVGGPRKVPYLGLWVLLAVLSSISYIVGQLSSDYLTDPVRIVYQLYRYAWKPILFYPLAAVFLSGPRETRDTLYVVIAAGALCALQSIPQGYSGQDPLGPFKHPNALAGALVVPIVFTFTMLAATGGAKRRLLLLSACLVILLGGILFAGSRGAFAALLVGLGLASFFLFMVPGTRSRIVRFAAPVGLATLLVLMIPGVLDRPTISRALTLAQGTSSDTFQWRVRNRWPYFIRQAMDRPLLGTGRGYDRALGSAGNTPHNGYIALAVKRGFPALAIYLSFALVAIRGSLRLVRDPRPNPWGPVTGVLCIAGISALLVHNIVESNFEVPFLSQLLWCYIALALVASQTLREASLGGRGSVLRHHPSRPASREIPRDVLEGVR